MKRTIFAALCALSLNSCIVVVPYKTRACAPLNSYGTSKLSISVNENTKVDRGQLTQTVHNGPYRFYNETFGPTLYIYEGDQLKARVINPASVEFN